MLDAKQSALFRMALDPSVTDHEALTATRLLRASLTRAGIDAYALLDAMEKAGVIHRRLAETEERLRNAENAARYAQMAARVASSKPDPGLTVIHFGKNKGKMIKDVSPSDLRWLRNWATEREIFDDLVDAIEEFLA